MAPLPSARSWPFNGEFAARSAHSTTSAIAELPSRILERRAAGATVDNLAKRASGCSGVNLTPGGLAGVIIGTIAGTLLVLWLVYSCSNLGAPMQERDPSMYRDVKPARHRHSGQSRRHSRHSSRRRHSSDMSQAPPVVIRESSRRQQPQPTHAFGNGDRGRTYV